MLELEPPAIKSGLALNRPQRSLVLPSAQSGKMAGRRFATNPQTEPQTEPQTIGATNLSARADQLASWCTTQALPLWASKGVRPEGGFHEFLRADGMPRPTAQYRVRVQARMAYVYAISAHLGWGGDRARAMSDRAWDFTMTVGSEVQSVGAHQGFSYQAPSYQGCAHLIGSDGQLIDDLRDVYAQSFVILAGAWRYRAFGDQASLQTARDLCAYLRSHFLAQNGGYLEDHTPNTAPQSSTTQPRRQNPHMHLFEAFIAMYDATKDVQYLDMAGEMFELFQRVFYDRSSQTLVEFFNLDWSRTTSTDHPNGGPLEPGHMMEWCWLLGEYAQRRGAQTARMVHPVMIGFYASAMRHGQSPSGLLYDFVWPNNSQSMTRPDLNLSCRTWPQTERLKADLALLKMARNQAEKNLFTTKAVHGADLLSQFFLQNEGTIAGGWVDQVDGKGRVMSDDIPASTFYHLICACAELSLFRSP